ncbi:protein YgfX [Undibacterium sp. SXout11W]|uniref:protein YgfX n=1 Tax=Undibacterium sp. SXout11W TaxID=3413050 RepID=UPI003BF11F63
MPFLLYMSIALTVIIKPSRIILYASLCMCFLASFALHLLLNQYVFFLLNPGSFYLIVILIFCLFSGYALRVWSRIALCRLDIAVGGAMILREIAKEHMSKTGVAVRVNSNTVIWNDLMVLHMSTDDSSKRTLIVMKDSLSAADFQRLRVSLLWARQHHLSNNKEKSQMYGNF